MFIIKCFVVNWQTKPKVFHPFCIISLISKQRKCNQRDTMICRFIKAVMSHVGDKGSNIFMAKEIILWQPFWDFNVWTQWGRKASCKLKGNSYLEVTCFFLCWTKANLKETLSKMQILQKLWKVTITMGSEATETNNFSPSLLYYAGFML